MEYIEDLLKRSPDFRITVAFSPWEKLYQATMQRRDQRNRWLHKEMGIGRSLASAIESLNEAVMEADGVGAWEDDEE